MKTSDPCQNQHADSGLHMQPLCVVGVILVAHFLVTLTAFSQTTTPCLFNPGNPNPWPNPIAADAGYIPLGNLGQEVQFSVSLWVKPDPVQHPIAVLVDASHAGGTNWVIQTENGGINWVFLGCEFALQPNAWQHLLCTYNNGVSKVFINGVLDDQAVWQIAWGNVPNVYIGNWPEGGRRFTGYIDDVLITRNLLFDDDFNPPEIFDNNNVPANSLGMWHCDEGVGQVTLNELNNQNEDLNGWQWDVRPVSLIPSGGVSASSLTIGADAVDLGLSAVSRLVTGPGAATIKLPSASGTLVVEGTTIDAPVGAVYIDASASSRDGYLVVK